MSASPQATAAEAWVDLILGTVDPAETWTAIFARLRELSLSGPGAAALHRETIVPDRLLAETAWDPLAAVSPLRPDRHWRTQTVLDQCGRRGHGGLGS